MRPDRRITLYHSPNTRSGGTRILLEELQADYDPVSYTHLTLPTILRV